MSFPVLIIEPDAWLQALGRMHPLVLHFPLALVLAAGFLELLVVLRGRSEASGSVKTCLVLGALGALAAGGTGWLFAEYDGPGSSLASTLLWHRWTAIAGGALTLVAAFLAPSGGKPRGGRAFHVVLAGAVVLVAAAGHLGGDMTWGEGFVLEPLEAASAGGSTSPTSPTASTGTASSGSEHVGNGTSDDGAAVAIDYQADIQPIFEAHCYECHGPTKQKGDLRLDDIDALFVGDESTWVIRPGDARGSPLYERVTLPADDLDIMPAKGDPLTPEQIAAIGSWIDAGASHGS
jgi:uncharacterized membrane protein